MTNAGPKKALLDFVFKHAFLRGRFELSSGKISDFYLDAKQATMDPAGALLVAEAYLEKARACEADAIGGLMIGADPIVGAVVCLSGLRGYPIRGFIVRKKVKGHGRQRRIEGKIQQGDRVIVIDDVVTTGGSAMEAVQAVETQGGKVIKVVPLIDRNEGGRQCFKDYDYDPIIMIEDIFEREALESEQGAAG